MADPRDDGGPAFPETSYYDDRPVGSSGGMTLRDYFAGQAIIGCLDDARQPAEPEHLNRELWFQWVAEAAYELADAMLEARRK